MTTTQRGPTIVRDKPTTERLRWIDVALLGSAAAFVPLDVMANNPFDIGHPERILALVGLLWIGILIVVSALVRLGVRSTTAVSSAFLAVVLTMTSGPLLTRLGEPTGSVTLLVLTSTAVFLISRLESHAVLSIALFSLAAFLISGPTIAVVGEIAERGPDTVVEQEAEPIGLSRMPDIFLVVLDGYAGRKSLSENLGVDQPGIVEALQRRGYEVPTSAWSSYPATRSSVPSLLDMSYPLESGSVMSATTEKRLSDMLGGSNTVSSTLEAEGYELVMIESGWSGSRCGPAIDECVDSPLIDEAIFSIVERTVVGPTVLREVGYSFTVGAQHTMSWLRANSASLSRDQVPSFVFAHVMAPHPPFFLDATCETTFDETLSGVQFARPFDDIESRQAAYLEQTECLNRFMIDLGEEIDADDIVIFVGDHGTDLRNQLTRDPASWSVEDLAERFNVFLAVRDAQGCPVGDTIMLPNLLRRVLSCLSPSGLEDLDQRMFKYAQNWDGVSASEVLEVDRSLVAALVGP